MDFLAPAPNQLFQTRNVRYTSGANGIIQSVAVADYPDLIADGCFPLALGNPAANFRNLLDGGDFTVNPWQRNIPGLASGGVISAAITNTPTYFADRWFGQGGASSSVLMANVASTAVPGFNTQLNYTRSSGNANTAALFFGQVLETADSIRLQGLPVTFSFWAASLANYSGGPLTVQLISGTGTNDTAAHLTAAAWAGATNVVNTTVALTSTPTRYQFVGTVPANATQLGVLFTWTPTGTAGAADGISYAGLQLEIGAFATAFEHRDVQVELEICQRYAWIIAEPAAGVVIGTGNMPTTTTATFYMATPVQLRAAPTVTVVTGSFGSTAANVARSGTIAAGSTHTPNAITITASGVTAAASAGLGASLVGGAGAGYIVASSDY
jgi:hypothetical protein